MGNFRGKGKGKGKKAGAPQPGDNTNGKGKGKGEGKDNGKGKDAMGKGKGMEDVAGEGGGASSSSTISRNPNNFEWGGYRLKLFHISVLQRSGGRSRGYQATCRFHQPHVSTRSTRGLPLPCSREYTAAEDTDESLQECLHSLMHWCLHAEEETGRAGHMNWQLHQR